MNKTQEDPNAKTRDPHGLIKLVLIIVGFIGLMILLKYLLDILK